MKRRLAILTEIIAPYRIPVFNALAAQPDIDLHVIFLSETDPSLRQWPIYKDEIRFSYEVLPYWRRRVGKYNLLFNRGMAASLRRFAPNAIVCGGYSYLSSWATARWARRNQIPLLLWSESTANDSRDSHGPVEFLKSHFLERCQAFIVPGKAAFSYLRFLGVPSTQIFTAPNAVDTGFFAAAAQASLASPVQPKNITCGRFFLYVGRLVTEKGIFELLDAYARLDPVLRSEVGLVFVGDGQAKSELAHRIRRLKEPHICCQGFLRREELAGLYARAEALVLPTHSDTWGLVVNEAMVCGTPVITTDVAGCVPDLVENGGTGLLVPPKNVPALALAMRALLRNPELKLRMKTRAAHRIRAYSPQVWAEGVIRALDFVCPRPA